ncbi:MAG: hypothetical protein KF782_15410 [Labilithrix sp.]|nr:hypothetical protein [Labilithrix sp.]
MMELLVFAGALLAPATFFAGRYVRGRRTTTPPEPLCTGYLENNHPLNKLRHDCRALRSVLCNDGRCSFHCASMCKCEGGSLP